VGHQTATLAACRDTSRRVTDADNVTISPLGRVAVSTRTWRRGGTRNVTVILKATFAMVADGPMLPTEPIPVFDRELHNADNPALSVCATTDRAPFLGRADVVFRGAAYPPGGQPVETLTVRMAILRGSAVVIDKRLEIRGDQEKEPSGELSPITPFARMPIVYDRALGGIGNPQNPLGVGLSPSANGRIRMPNVLSPADATMQWEPAGLAPVSAVWPARKRLLAGKKRSELEQPDAEMPDGIEGYFQAAPPDQQTDFLVGEEFLMLKHLTPHIPAMMTSLPRVTGHARASIQGGAAFDVPLVADTLFIDGDEARVAVVWRGHFAAADGARVRCAAGVSLRNAPLTFPDLTREPAADARRSSPSAATPREQSPYVVAADKHGLGGTMVIEAPAAPAAPAKKPLTKGTMIIEPEAPAPGPRRQSTMLLEQEPSLAPARPPAPSPPAPSPPALSPPAPPPPAVRMPTPPPPTAPLRPLPASDNPLASTMAIPGGALPSSETTLPFHASRDKEAPPKRPSVSEPIPGAPWASDGALKPPPAESATRSTLTIEREAPPETMRLQVKAIASARPPTVPPVTQPVPAAKAEPAPAPASVPPPPAPVSTPPAAPASVPPPPAPVSTPPAAPASVPPPPAPVSTPPAAPSSPPAAASPAGRSDPPTGDKTSASSPPKRRANPTLRASLYKKFTKGGS
jgi:hypothetical protein